jgi:hypothetical protein
MDLIKLMNEDQQILSLIEDFNNEVKLAVQQFYNKYNRTDLLRAWHDTTIPRSGKLNNIVIHYAFHGAGLYAQLKNKKIDFDFGKDNRIDGFDAWRLKSFADSQTKKYNDYWTLEKLEIDLVQLENKGIIVKPGDGPGTSNYYLKDSLST